MLLHVSQPTLDALEHMGNSFVSLVQIIHELGASNRLRLVVRMAPPQRKDRTDRLSLIFILLFVTFLSTRTLQVLRRREVI